MDISKLTDAVQGASDAAEAAASDTTSNLTNAAAAGVAGAADAANSATSAASGLTNDGLSGALSSAGVNLNTDQVSKIMDQLKSGNLDLNALKNSLGDAGKDLNIDSLKASLSTMGIDADSVVSGATAEGGGLFDKVKNLLKGH